MKQQQMYGNERKTKLTATFQ